MIKVNIDTTEAIAGLNDLQKQHIRFALAKTLTSCAEGGRNAVQHSMFSKFHLRNNWTVQGVRMKPADKNSNPIQAIVFTDTSNRQTGAPDYLLEQRGRREGSVRRSAALSDSHKVSPPNVPRSHPARTAAAQPARRGRWTLHGHHAQRASDSIAGSKDRARLCILYADTHQRTPGYHGRYWTGRDAYPFYILIPDGMIKPRLQMEAIVQDVVTDIFPAVWARVWREIMARGLRITS